MKRKKALRVLPVIVLLQLAGMGAGAAWGQAVYTPPLVGFGDLAVHDLYLEGLDLPPTSGTAPLLGSGASGTWEVTVQNTGSMNWTDFHMTVISELSGVEFVPNVTVSGWGTLPAQNFDLTGNLYGINQADFVAPAGQTVPPGGQITLNVPVTNFNATYGVRHHLQLQATVPEPGTLSALGLAGVGMLCLRRRARASA